MAIEHFTAFSSETLRNRLAEDFKTTKMPVFRPIHLISQNRAQHDWLKEGLAEQLEIVANLKQHNLDGFINWLLLQFSEESNSLKGKEELIWELFGLLGSEEFKSRFSRTAEYCGDDQVKRLALAQKLVGLFANYSQHRKDLLEEWRREGIETTRDWQVYLFLKSGFLLNHQDNLNLLDRLRSLELKNRLKEKLEPLFIFGNLHPTPLQKDILEALAENVEIKMYRTAVAQTRGGNPLLESWGQQNLILDNLFGEGNRNQGEELPLEITTLGCIQKGLLEDTILKRTDQKTTDNSVTIYSSFTKIREVEALFNYLVKLTGEKEGKLGASDIQVVIPNLDSYIAPIKTVFDGAELKFPYTIVSRGYSREESFWTALEKLLSFEEDQFTAPAVFDLLELQPVQKCWGFSDLELLFKAFGDANIRREYEGNPDYETNYSSFRHGLKRLIYGFTLGSEEPVEIGGETLYPVDIAEGQQAQDFYRLHYFVEQLQELVQEKRQSRTAKEWDQLLMEVADIFLRPEENHQRQLSLLLEKIGTQADNTEALNFTTYFFRLKDQLQDKDLQQIKGRGGIVFSGLYPGISLPRKVMAFLGMNFTDFPRKGQQLSFDKLSDQPAPTDPQQRLKDRAAFMEAFLNAKEHVLLSYIGQNVKDNSEIPPSAMISEIQDYAEKINANLLLVKHPLHSFNSAYFDQEQPEVYTYLVPTEKAFDLKYVEEKKETVVPGVIHLRELESFLKDPFKHHYRKVLNIYYKENSLLEENELFELSKLQEWVLKDAQLKLWLEKELKEQQGLEEKEEQEMLRLELVQKAKLPLKIIGSNKLQEAKAQVDNLCQELQGIKQNSSIGEVEYDLSVSVRGKETLLHGTVDVINRTGIFLCVSKEGTGNHPQKWKYLLAAYIRYLFLRAGKKGDGLIFLCFTANGVAVQRREITGELTPQEAKGKLSYFLGLLMKSHEELIPFSPDFNFPVSDLRAVSDEEGEEIQMLQDMIDGKFNETKTFFPSDYMKLEHQKGFFKEENLLLFKQQYLDIMEDVVEAFT